jgi:hypothetical protein
MTGFGDVKIILDHLINGEDIHMHGAFWRGKSRDEFVALNVMGLPIVAVGDSDNSNLVKALRGLPPFGRDLQPRPPGARFNRMPSRRPPATEADIAKIEIWIKTGCPEDAPAGRSLTANAREAGTGAGDNRVHVRFWREFDDFFLFKSSDETKEHVFGFIGNSVPIWLNGALAGNGLEAWAAHIANPQVRASIDYILKHHIRLIEAAYGSPMPAPPILEGYWRFGGNLLPDDPDSSGPVRHAMNSTGDWFNWSPFLDAIVRFDGASTKNLLLARGWHIGLVADGLLRTDADRPPTDRVRITDFQATDPKLFQAVVARYANAPPADLLAEFVRRTQESGVFGASVA